MAQTTVNPGTLRTTGSGGRAKFIIGGVLIAAAIIYLIVSTLQSTAQYFYTVDEIKLKGASIALPSLGTGAYGIPITKASRIAVTSALEHQALGSPPIDVIFCCFGDTDARHYEEALDWARNILPPI